MSGMNESGREEEQWSRAPFAKPTAHEGAVVPRKLAGQKYRIAPNAARRASRPIAA
jgi:hypothetical protein